MEAKDRELIEMVCNFEGIRPEYFEERWGNLLTYLEDQTAGHTLRLLRFVKGD